MMSQITITIPTFTVTAPTICHWVDIPEMPYGNQVISATLLIEFF